MAKRKKSKSDSSKSFRYSVELTGLLLIAIGIFGFGFGAVGGILKKFAMFLTGEWWPLLLIFLLVLGTYMLFKRELPKFIAPRFIGFYILVIVILALSHFTYVKELDAPKEIFQTTIDHYMERVSTMPTTGGIISAGESNVTIGGGIIGASFAFLFSFLFGEVGMVISVVILSVFGMIMLFNITLSNVFSKIKDFFGMFGSKRREKIRGNDDEDDENDDDKKIIITSVEELKNPTVYETDDVIVENLSEPNPKGFNNNYRLPPITLLENPVQSKDKNSQEFIKKSVIVLESILADFGIKAKVVEIHVGPAVTQFEISVPNGTKVSKISSIHGEIKMALAAREIRIEAPIPGKNTIGIEIPNPKISAVKLKEILADIPKSELDDKLLVALGKDIMGRTRRADLSKMPHLLVAGSTGSGKSVCINSMLISLLMRYKPDEIKIVLVDPKKVELSNYNGVPHLLCPVVTDPKKANVALQKIVNEMERRYDLFAEAGAKNIISYNDLMKKKSVKDENGHVKKLPYILVVIDELADLMLVAAKEVEESILRITQMARAAGIHLIVATQRPSTDVITGVVKANIGSRLSFAVASGIDSRTILDQTGAERLLGKGDMLFKPMDQNSPTRIQGCFVSDEEIAGVIDYVCKEQIASYDNSITELDDSHMAGANSPKESYDDPQYNEVVEFAVQTGKISASLIQRRFHFGYNRAARIMDLLEERGIVGAQNGSKPREVLVKLEGKSEE